MLYKTHERAFLEAKKLQQNHRDDGIMARVESSPYGGFHVKLVPIDLMIDGLLDNPKNITSRNYK